MYLTSLAISTCHPCPHPATSSLPTSLTSGPAAGSAGPGSMDPPGCSSLWWYCVQHQGRCQRKMCLGHLPSINSRSTRQTCEPDWARQSTMQDSVLVDKKWISEWGIKEDTKCGLGEQRWYFGGRGAWVGLHKMGELRNSKRRGNDIWGGAKSWAQRPRWVSAGVVRGFEKSEQCGISLWNGAMVNTLACPSSPQRWELY